MNEVAWKSLNHNVIAHMLIGSDGMLRDIKEISRSEMLAIASPNHSFGKAFVCLSLLSCLGFHFVDESPSMVQAPSWFRLLSWNRVPYANSTPLCNRLPRIWALPMDLGPLKWIRLVFVGQSLFHLPFCEFQALSWERPLSRNFAQ